MLALEGVTKSYGPRRLLSCVDLTLASGEFLAVMGESGVGKSTLLNLIAGLDQPDSGKVIFEGRELTGLDDDALTLIRRRRMGFVFQAFHVLPYLSVAQNVALPLLLNGIDQSEARRRVEQLLAMVGLEERASSHVPQLSGGETQRVAIARALAHRPRLVLADEPTGNLDEDSGHQVLDLLRACTQEAAAAVILVTHSRDAAGRADRVVRLTAHGLVPA